MTDSDQKVNRLLDQARILEMQRQLPDALELYDRIQKLQPSSAEVLARKGEVLGRLDRIIEAKRCFEAALEIDLKYAEAWRGLGVTIGSIGQSRANVYRELECYEHAITINPELTAAWFNKGMVLLEDGREDDAITCFERARDLGHPQARKALAKLK